MAIEKQCEWCGKSFTVRPYRKHTARFCSYDCHNKQEVDQVQKQCRQCGKEFSVPKSRGPTAKYCSCSCNGKNRVQAMFSTRARERMRESVKESFRRGRRTWNKGTVGVMVNHRKGERSNLWKGGTSKLWWKITNSIEYKLWRREVYIRDGFRCVWCGSQTHIEADHIEPKARIVRDFLTRHDWLKTDKEKVEAITKFCTELWDTNNGRTLCRACHKKTDTYAGNDLKG